MATPPAALGLLLIIVSYVFGQKIMQETDEITIVKNADMTLVCEHDKNITWLFPPNFEDETTTWKVKNYYEEGKYSALLLMNRPGHVNTGFYHCCEVVSNDCDDSPSIYVYVRDPNELFADPKKFDIIQANEGDDIVIPCRPTSKDIQVELSRNGVKLEEGETDMFEKGYKSYDPRIGFVYGPVQVSDSDTFECSATRDNQQSTQTFQITVHQDAPVEMPRPTVSAVRPQEGYPAILGDTVVINCVVMTSPGHHHVLKWTTPESVPERRKNVTENYNSKFVNGITHIITQSQLTISNVELSDAGLYTCCIQDHVGNSNSHNYQLHVESADSKYLNISLQGSKILDLIAGRDAQWITSIAANPQATVKWYNPDGKELPLASDKYFTEYVGGKSKVVVKQVSVEDSGVYKLIATNIFKTVDLNVTLLVQDSPHISFTSKVNYLKNQEYRLRCAVMAFPTAKIEWTFTPCPKYPNCPSGPSIPFNGEYISLSDYIRSESVLTLSADKTGVVTCNATNALGTRLESQPFLVTDVLDGFELIGPKETVAGDNVTFMCGISIYHYEGGFSWYFTNSVNQTREITVSAFPGTHISEAKGTMSYWSTLRLASLSKPLSGNYTCRVSTKHNSTTWEKTTHLVVKSLIPVKLKDTANMDGEERKTEKGDSFSLDCFVIGYPAPYVIWRKDGQNLELGTGLFRLEHHNQSLVIGHMVEELAGRYECTAINRGGKVVASKTLYMRKAAKFWYLAILVVLALIAIVCCILVFVFRTRLKKQKEEMTFAGLYNLAEGQTALINSQLDLTEQADLLPYDPRWEIPRSKIKFGQQLGSGAFGVVIKAKVFDLEGHDEPLTVAVKMVKKNSNLLMVKNLVSELKILAHLGKNLNVVNLIGACTENVANYELLVIVEYCKYGNIHNYLQKHRNVFINQVDPTTGCIDSNTRTIGKYNFSTSDGGFCKSVPLSTSEMSNNTSANTMVTSLSTPVGEDGYLLTRDSESNPQGYYQGDYKTSTVGPISTQDLLCWSYQIAKGMEYLASRKVLHGDLAARNVLLAERNVVKICDFGLAKNMYKDDNYCRKGMDLLPVKWMSIEALRDRIFSTQSDVWAFGVVLWELFSLARTPYPGINFNNMFINSLIQGYRMGKPEYSPDGVYTLMLECWSYEPMSRPSFSECAERLGNLIEDSIREHYSVLNDEYIKFNDLLGQEDYLAMMAAPTFINLTSPGKEDAVRYVNMRPHVGPTEPIELKPMLPESKE